jgi:predicted phosphodiesterase
MTSFSLQIASDLHLEFQKNPIRRWRNILEPSSPNLALVGDLCELSNKHLWCGFIEMLVPHWKHIFIVNGNHEYYVMDKTPTQCVSQLQKNQKNWVTSNGWTNVHILENEVYELNDDILILGCTLWSRIPCWAENEISQKLNDYRKIITQEDGKVRSITVNDTNKLHEKSVRWLYKKIESADKWCIVLTHHAPLIKYTSDPQYDGKKLNHAFATDLSGLITLPIKLWVFGHTHFSADFTHNDCRIVSNPLGYGDDINYDCHKVVVTTC